MTIYSQLRLRKSERGFEEVVSKKLILEPESHELTIVNLEDGTSETDELRFSKPVQGTSFGSYAPLANYGSM